MFFDVLTSIILFPFTVLGWIMGSMYRVTSTSVKIGCDDYIATRIHGHYKDYF